MSQYFCALTHGQKTYNRHFSTFTYGCGPELMSHAYIGSPYVDAVASTLVNKPQWLIWFGDYSEPNEKVNLDEVAFAKADRAAHSMPHSPVAINETIKNNNYFLINHSKKLFLDMAKYIKNAPREYKKNVGVNVIIHPLPLLTASSNGKSEGDYYPDSKYAWSYSAVGSWCNDMIEISDTPYDGFKEIMIYFQQQ